MVYSTSIKISRILKLPKGNLIIVSKETTGRRSMIKFSS